MDIKQDIVTVSPTNGHSTQPNPNKSFSFAKPVSDNFDAKKIIYKLWRNKFLLLIGLSIAIGLAWWQTYHATPVYRVGSALQIKPNNKAQSPSKILYNTDMFGDNKRLSAEVKFIQSYPFLKRVLERLDFRVSYFVESSIRTSEIFPSKNAPFEVLVDIESDSILSAEPAFNIKADGEQHFLLIFNHQEWDAARKYKFGETVTEANINFKILNKGLAKQTLVHGFHFHNPSTLARDYANRLSIYPEEDASVLRISMTSTVPKRAQIFLDGLMQEYILYGLEDKNIEAVRTIDFIDNQLAQIRDSLFSIEDKIQNFKVKNPFIVGEDAMSRNLEQYTSLEDEYRKLLMRDKYIDYLSEYIKANDDFKGITTPAAVGVEDGIASSLIARLVDLQIKREIYLEKGHQKNPFLIETNTEIKKITESLIEHLKNSRQSNNIAKEDLKSRMASLNKQLNSLPSFERQLVNINRLYNINENIYLLLLNKRMEASIAQAAAREDSQILEPPFSYGTISPNAKKNYALALAIGLGLILGFIFVKDYFRNTIESVDEVKAKSSVPLLGVVMHSKQKRKDDRNTPLVHERPKSALAEAFRSIRSNLLFLMGRVDQTHVLMISSSISGEGKSFCSANISISLASTGKRTILIVADMRKPQMYVPMPNGEYKKEGLSTYLIGSASLEQVIQSTSVENLDLIYSGAVPPNPAELLMGEVTTELIEQLKQHYDYIIIDTPPLGLVSDALILGKYADATAYIVRQDRTPIEKLEGLENIYQEQMLKNVGIVFNDVKAQAVGTYGYGSYGGYGYYDLDHSELPWWKKILFWQNK